MRLFFFSSSSSSSSSSTSPSSGGDIANDKKRRSKKVTRSAQSRRQRTPPPPIIIPNSDCPSSFSFSSLSSLQTPTPDKISREEIELVLRRLGGEDCDAEADDISAIIAEAGRGDGDGLISVDRFTGFPGDQEELRVAFGVFDANGDGKISAEELHDAFAMLGDANCTVEECRRMIGGVDSDGDGFVSFGDFVTMMAMDGRT